MKYSDIPISYYMDYEEPEPTPQPRCPKCGRFLSWNPSGKMIQSEPNGHWDYNTDKWIQDGPDFQGSITPIWNCTCGNICFSEDIFK